MIGTRTVSMFKRHRDAALWALDGLSEEWKAIVITTSAVYPRTASVKHEKALVEEHYDGTALDFTTACARLENNVELKALGTHHTVMDILNAIRHSQTDLFLDLGLKEVDGIVFQRLGRRVVHIKRELSPGEVSSGRTLFLELNDVRQHTSTILTTLKAKGADYTVAIIFAGLSVATSVGFAAFYMR